MPEPRTRFAAALLGDNIWVVSGFSDLDGTGNYYIEIRFEHSFPAVTLDLGTDLGTGLVQCCTICALWTTSLDINTLIYLHGSLDPGIFKII